MNGNKNWLADFAELAAGAIGIVVLIGVVKWMIGQGINSWRTKDENYRRDCVLIPVIAGLFVVATLVLGICTLFGIVHY
jgi:hypothetical protein